MSSLHLLGAHSALPQRPFENMSQEQHLQIFVTGIETGMEWSDHHMTAWSKDALENLLKPFDIGSDQQDPFQQDTSACELPIDDTNNRRSFDIEIRIQQQHCYLPAP